MLPTHVAWDDVVDGQAASVLAAILASKIITTEDLSARQTNRGAGSMHHLFQTDDGRARKRLAGGPDFPASVQYKTGFVCQHHSDGAMHIAYVDRFEVGIEDKDGFHAKILPTIIALFKWGF